MFDAKNIQDAHLYQTNAGVGFTPKLDYAYNSGASTITLTDTSTYASSDDRAAINVEVADGKGNRVTGRMAGDDSDDAISIDVSALDKTNGFFVSATIATTKGLTADGHVSHVGSSTSSGSLGSWKKLNSTVMNNV